MADSVEVFVAPVWECPNCGQIRIVDAGDDEAIPDTVKCTGCEQEFETETSD